MRVHSVVVPLQGDTGRVGPFPKQLETPRLLPHWEIIMQNGFLVGSLFVCRKSSLWTLEAEQSLGVERVVEGVEKT